MNAWVDKRRVTRRTQSPIAFKDARFARSQHLPLTTRWLVPKILFVRQSASHSSAASMTIRVKQCAAILDSLPEWFGDARAVSDYLNDLPCLKTYLAQRDSEIVGFAAVKPTGSQNSEIHVMGVAREERRRGVGRALMNRMVEDLTRSESSR